LAGEPCVVNVIGPLLLTLWVQKLTVWGQLGGSDMLVPLSL